jgi:hypothetical protein
MGGSGGMRQTLSPPNSSSRLRPLPAGGLRDVRSEAWRQLIKITDVTGHRSLEMLKTYSRDADAFVGHAGAGLL